MSLLKKLKTATGRFDGTSTPKTESNNSVNLLVKQTEKLQMDDTTVVDVPKKTKILFSDLSIDRTLGTGSFGRVHLVKQKTGGKFMAMKVLKKAEIVRMKQVEHTVNEKAILEQLDHPFLISMYGTMQDCSNIYFVMEFVQGGELFSYLRRCGVGLRLV